MSSTRPRSLAEELAKAAQSAVSDQGELSSIDASDENVLTALEEEERALSTLRRKVHERIDFLEAVRKRNAAATAQLEAFKRSETYFSARRKQLHGTIDRVRAVQDERVT